MSLFRRQPKSQGEDKGAVTPLALAIKRKGTSVTYVPAQGGSFQPVRERVDARLTITYDASNHALLSKDGTPVATGTTTFTLRLPRGANVSKLFDINKDTLAQLDNALAHEKVALHQAGVRRRMISCVAAAWFIV